MTFDAARLLRAAAYKVLCQQFLPRDAVHCADYAITRYLSVRLTVMVQYYIKPERLKISMKF